MEKTYVRVYHLRDGKKCVAGAYYPTEESAVNDLYLFNPVQEGKGYVPDYSILEYATIEVRYTPLPAVDSNWKVDNLI